MSTTTPISTGVDFICIPTQDFAVALQFYGAVLGLPGNASILHHRYALRGANA